MEIQEILEKLGFSHHESVVYKALLERGAMNVSDICGATNMHRPAVYKTIASLKIKDVISTSPLGKRRLYVAESPAKLEGPIASLSESMQGALSILTNAYQKKGQRPIINFYEGKHGITAVFDDIVNSLHKGDVFYRYSSRSSLNEDGDHYLSSRYRKIRDEKQIERLVITNQKMLKAKKPRLEREVKIIPPSFDPFDYNIVQVIYGPKTALIDYNTETALVIENKQIAKFFTKLFKLLYSKL